MKKGLYRGYSSFEYQRSGTFKLEDIELVKMDLLNHIFTRKGERVMMPTYGTNIPDLVFEPMDAQLVDSVRDELTAVFDFDPRVQILKLEIQPSPDQNSIHAAAQLKYIELNMVDIMYLNIELESV